MENLDRLKAIFGGKEITLPHHIRILMSLKKEYGISEISYGEIIKMVHDKGEQSAKMRDFLKNEVLKLLYECGECPLHLAECHTQKVPGDGDWNSPLMLIGEGPGFEEDKQGKPFVGRAGQLLTAILNKLNIDRKKVYITNVVKCRPPMNRTPQSKEIKACKRILELELEFIAPKVIITLGSVPLNYFKPNSSIMQSRGQWIYKRGFWIMPTFHPAYILRQGGETLKRVKWQVWGDFNKAIEKVRELSDYKFN
ncbi:uracil-DNA glycosylase [Thermosediminibacter oceani]|uniref:Type-4 uracil-DNA glycosylase n=1 Tax=Thermosediminibacter oceani (strain ATCC BAA-1034 / DSM 16646 / JW/IW-1228P) TaxID=555079 RepID=D9S3H2_THEOJ|nr:uracil-DNA glycosylase [Thermosediminibacter oceani]ADL07949.1 phage SPO1 DNA polymerase-related protein [Thermosediminibacter oceani DSM 16646]